MKSLTNRREFVFLYEGVNDNPNGDPNNDNKPRMDEETEHAIISKERIKRYARDYAIRQDMEIYVKQTLDEKGNLHTSEGRVDEILKIYGNDETVYEKLFTTCVDLRWFGGQGGKGKTLFTATGPIQIFDGQTLNVVEPQLHKLTAAFASDEGKSQKSFGQRWFIPYSCILFEGIANENVAKETYLSDADYDLLLKCLWYGLLEGQTSSKRPNPLLLIDITYEGQKHIGNLYNYIKLIPNEGVTEKEIRSIKHYTIDINELGDLLQGVDNITQIRINRHPLLKFSNNMNIMDLDKAVELKF